MGRYAAVVAAVLVMGTAPLYAQDARFVVMTTSADIHKAPSTGSAVIGKASRGMTFEVRRELGSWVSVSWPDADQGVAYLHVAWGRISRGAPDQEPPAAGAGLSAVGPASASNALTTGVQIPQAPRTTTVPRRASSLPSHAIGLGGRMGSREIGFAASGRAWAYGPFGVQIEAGRSMYTSAVASGQLRSLRLAPSVMYSPPDLVTNAIWARPYVGAGVDFHRTTLRNTGGADAVDRLLGSHLFGGAEFTWANLPQFTLSADLRQQWAPPTFTGFELGGFGVSLSAHWYVK